MGHFVPADFCDDSPSLNFNDERLYFWKDDTEAELYYR